MEVWEKKNLAHNIYIILKCDGEKKSKIEKRKKKKEKKQSAWESFRASVLAYHHFYHGQGLF